MQAHSLTKVQHTGIRHNQTLSLIPTTQPEVIGVITIREEVTVRHDLIPQAMAVPQATALDREAPAVEVEAVLEADNIKNIDDYEEVHPTCSNSFFILIWFLCSVNG